MKINKKESYKHFPLHQNSTFTWKLARETFKNPNWHPPRTRTRGNQISAICCKKKIARSSLACATSDRESVIDRCHGDGILRVQIGWLPAYLDGDDDKDKNEVFFLTTRITMKLMDKQEQWEDFDGQAGVAIPVIRPRGFWRQFFFF